MLPRLTPYGRQRERVFFRRYWKHREYEASIGCVVVLAVLIVKLVLQASVVVCRGHWRVNARNEPQEQAPPGQAIAVRHFALGMLAFSGRRSRCYGASSAAHRYHRPRSRRSRLRVPTILFPTDRVMSFRRSGIHHCGHRHGEDGDRRKRTQSHCDCRIRRSRQRHVSGARPLRIALRSANLLLDFHLQA